MANAPYQAGIEVAPEASAESRELVVQVTTGRSLRKLVGCWIRLTAGFGPDPDKTVTLRAPRMHIDAVPRQYVSMDGEAFIHTPFDVEVAQQALLMMAPRTNPELR